MTDRLALLPLTGAVERECRDCVYLDRSHCDAFEASLPVSAVPWRLPACLAAEQAAARLRAVEVAARAYVDADDAAHAAIVEDGLCYGSDTEAAIKAANDAWAALRAALKE